MIKSMDTIIIGGGQAGLAVSYFLTKRKHEHIILEKASQPGNVWRNYRWDSFTFVTPNWTIKLPGAEYNGDHPDGFMPRDEIVKYFENYVSKYKLPVKYNEEAISVEYNNNEYTVTSNKKKYKAKNVVAATGSFQKPKIPKFSRNVPSNVKQLHSMEYRNPDTLNSGNVLIVGSAQSGCQIAEDLKNSGRDIYLSTCSIGRMPRRWRGKDIMYWLQKIGLFDRSVNDLPSPELKFGPNPQITGANGGYTINLHQFARDGVKLLGRLLDIHDNKIILASDLKENLKKIDQFEAELIQMIDSYIDENGLKIPTDSLQNLKDGYDVEPITELSFNEAGITNIIWATGYSFDYSIVKLPVFDETGYPKQSGGVTEYPGLYFVGLLWLTKTKSSLLIGVGEDAEFISSKILSGS
jgi:putative flavoprotein involved in K+ transport